MPKSLSKAPIDLVFVVDTTGSMGSEITSVKNNLKTIINKISALPQCTDIRFGLIEYKDFCDPYTSKVLQPLSTDVASMQKAVNTMSATGGGDYPEAVTDSLLDLVQMDWRLSAAKTAVLIADAPPHGVGGSGDRYPNGPPNGESWREQIETMREMGIVLHTVMCRGCREKPVYQNMSDETFGRCLDLRNAQDLVKLVTGCAENDLDKERVADIVVEAMSKDFDELKEFPEEEDRLEGVWGLLLEQDVKVREIDASFKLKEREVTLKDIEAALRNIRRGNKFDRLNQLFPTKGLSSTQKGKGGLFDANNSEIMIPLTGVEVSASIVDMSCNVQIVQHYENKHDSPIEAVYKFPIDELAAVSGFTAKIGDKTIVAVCKGKEEAKADYQAAISSGKTAALLEQKTADLFEMTVGNIKAGEKVTITISYVTQVERDEDGQLRFVLPTTVAPPYRPPSLPTSKKGEAPKKGTEHVGDYELSLEVKVRCTSGVSGVRSPSHEISSSEGDDGVYKVTLKDATAKMDSDFVLLVDQKERGGSCLVEKYSPESAVDASAKGKKSVMAVFVPEYEDEFIEDATHEVVLAIDCSASMAGAQMDLARSAAQFFCSMLKDMPRNASFNVVSFGSRPQSLFSSGSRKVSDKAAQSQAEAHVKDQLEASMGGTQLRQVLEQLAKKASGATTKVIVVTDGEIAGQDEVLSVAEGNASKLQIFTIGVGYAVSHSVIRGLARRTKGAHEFCLPGEDIEVKMDRHLRRIFSPLSDVKVSWGSAPVDYYAPKDCGAVISGQPVVCYALLDDEIKDKKATLSLTGKWKGKDVVCSLEMDPSKSVEGRSASRLAARAVIKEMEAKGETHKAEIIYLASVFTLASKFTSFVAVEESEIPDKPQKPKKIEVPSHEKKRENTAKSAQMEKEKEEKEKKEERKKAVEEEAKKKKEAEERTRREAEEHKRKEAEEKVRRHRKKVEETKSKKKIPKLEVDKKSKGSRKKSPRLFGKRKKSSHKKEKSPRGGAKKTSKADYDSASFVPMSKSAVVTSSSASAVSYESAAAPRMSSRSSALRAPAMGSMAAACAPPPSRGSFFSAGASAAKPASLGYGGGPGGGGGGGPVPLPSSAYGAPPPPSACGAPPPPSAYSAPPPPSPDSLISSLDAVAFDTSAVRKRVSSTEIAIEDGGDDLFACSDEEEAEEGFADMAPLDADTLDISSGLTSPSVVLNLSSLTANWRKLLHEAGVTNGEVKNSVTNKLILETVRKHLGVSDLVPKLDSVPPELVKALKEAIEANRKKVGYNQEEAAKSGNIDDQVVSLTG